MNQNHRTEDQRDTKKMEDEPNDGSIGRVKRLTRQYSTLNRRLREEVEKNQKRISIRKSLNANTFINPQLELEEEKKSETQTQQFPDSPTTREQFRSVQERQTIREFQITQETIVLQVDENEPKEHRLSSNHTNNEIETKKHSNDNEFSEVHESNIAYNFSENDDMMINPKRSPIRANSLSKSESRDSTSSIEQALYSAVQNTLKEVFGERNSNSEDEVHSCDENQSPKDEQDENFSSLFKKPRSTTIASPEFTTKFEPQLAQRSPATRKKSQHEFSKSAETLPDLPHEDLSNDNSKSRKGRKHAKTEVKKMTRAEIKDHQASKSDIKFLTTLTNGTYCVAFREWIRQRGSSNPDLEDPNHEKCYMDELTAKKMLLKLDFWIHIESFKNWTPKNHEIVMNEAALLISKYVTRGRNIRESQTLIEDISWDIVMELEENKEKLNLGSFNRVQHQLFQSLLQVWPKFKKSQLYKTLKAELRKGTAKKTARKWKHKLSLSKGKGKHKMQHTTFSHIATERIAYPKNEHEADTRIEEFKKHRRIQMKLDRLGLETCPVALCELSVIHLDLSQNNLVTIPSQLIITNLMYIKEIYLDFNFITTLPNELTFCSFLKVLSVNFNNITSLPDNIGSIETLQYLGIEGNPLTVLPPSLVNLSQLHELRHDDKEYDIPSSILSQKQVTKALMFENLLEYLDYLKKFEVRFNMKSHWVPDKAVTACSECHTEFSKVTRRHHCRFCGQLFCKDCWGFKVFIPYSQREHPVCGACHAALCSLPITANNSNTNLRSSSWDM